MKPVYPPKHSLVSLIWTDSVSRDGWKYDDQLTSSKCPNINAVGYVINVDRHHIALAGNLGEHGDAALAITCYPWGAVKSLKCL